MTKNPNAIIKYIRISPSKLRRVADLVRGKEVRSSLMLLKNLPHKGAKILYEAIHSAKSNAVNNHDYDENSGIIVSKLLINEGPRIKRFQSRARGRVFQILKRTSHIYVEIEKQGAE